MLSKSPGPPKVSSSPLLSAWLGTAVPPTAELAHEAFQAIGRCANVLAGWRPHESQWLTVCSIARDECAKLELMYGAHSSSLAPKHVNAMFGDFRSWPLYSGLVAGAANPTDATWSFVAALVAWPALGSNVAGMRVGEIAKSHQLSLQTWLRESVRNADSLAAMQRLLDGALPTPRNLLLTSRSLKGKEAKWWAALKAYARAYCTSYQDSLLIPPTPADGDVPKPPAPGIRKIIDHSVATRPENEGLAPDDAGATRYVSHDAAYEADTTDPLTRHRVRCLASAREYNHLPLHWIKLNPEERRVMRDALQTAIFDRATQDGAIAIAMCALLSLSPADVSGLAIHASLTEAVDALTKVSTTLVWVDDQLVALQGVPRPECAFRQGKGMLLLPHRTYKALGLPSEITQVITAAGGRNHDKLLCCFPALVVAARELAAKWRRTTGARLHLGRIQRVVADRLLEKTYDECIVEATLPGARVPTGAGSYYSAIPASRAFTMHREAASDVLPWAIKDLPPAVSEHFRGCYIGSELLIPIDALKNALAALYDRARTSSTTGRRTIDVVANAFNFQTMYLVAIGTLLTTHRPTLAPFPRPDDLEPSLCRGLIIDKRAHARSTQRVVPLPESLAAQVEAYRKSARAVVGFLDDEHPNLAGALRSTLDERATGFPSAAALSLLAQVDGSWQLKPFSPEDWKTLWPEWTWPLNGNRHILTQWLQAQQVRRESINYLLGHAEAGQALFGRDCAVTIDAFCAEMKPILQRFGDSLGIRHLQPMRLYSRVATQAEPIQLAAPGFGDDARPPIQQRLSGAELETCRRILRDDVVTGASSDEERASQISALVAREFQSDAPRRARALALLLRWQRTQPTGEFLAKGRRIPFAIETTPVTRTELRDLVRGRQLQQALLQFACDFATTQEAVQEIDAASWWALLSLVATAFGGKHTHDKRHLWLEAIPSGTFHAQGSLWIEWNQGNGLKRWCADPISALLITRFLRRAPADMPRPADKSVRAATNRILADLVPLKGMGTAKQRLRAFAEAMRALHRSSIPGPLMAHMIGERHSAAVPRETLLRSTGVRLVPDPALLEELVVHVGKRHAGTVPEHQADPSGAALKLLVKAIGKAQGSSSRGGKASGRHGSRISHLKADLRQLEASTYGSDTTFKIVCSRVRELATEGGRLKRILATSTIAAYMRPVIAFARTEVGREFLNADPLAIEEAYRNLVMTGCNSKAFERLASLQDFHEHAVVHFGAAPVDWLDVASDLPHAAKRINANLVYAHEVDLACALIAAMEDLPAHLVLMAQATLHLMHDLGLRFGEVFRLRAKDVLTGATYLYVRSTEHGEVKTSSGVRMVPLRNLLGAPGHAALSSLLDRANTLSKSDPITPLFCDPDDPSALVLRADVVRIVSHALRVATGDLTIRPHHLRHSAVTNSYGLLVVDGLDDEWARGAALRNELISEVDATRRATHAHSQLFGHGGPDTTAIIYLHQQEFRVSNWMVKLLPDMTSVEIAGLTGWTDVRVRKAWSADKSTVEILRMAVSGALKDRTELDAWRGIQSTADPLPMTTRMDFARPAIELPKLREFLLHHIQRGLPPEALARLYGVPPVFAASLCRNLAVAVHHTTFALSFVRVDEYRLWPGYSIRTTRTHQLPPHLATLPSIKRMDGLSASRELADIASSFVRTFDPDQNCWDVSTCVELDAVTRWMQSVGIEPHDVTFEMPCFEDRVPDSLQMVVGNFQNANFLRIAPRQGRRRGGDQVRIRVRPDGFSAAATTLAQATFLWVVRVLASLEAYPVRDDH